MTNETAGINAGLSVGYGTFRQHILRLMEYTRNRNDQRVGHEPEQDIEMGEVDWPPQRRRAYAFSSENDLHSPYRIERMVGVPDDDAKSESCYSNKIVDYSEPFLYLLSILTTAGLLYVGIADFSTFMLIVMCYTLMISFIAIWRVRKLGIAKSLMDSVRRLKAENERMSINLSSFEIETQNLKEKNNVLAENIESIQTENQKLLRITGLLGENVGDLEETKEALLKELSRLEGANRRYEANNLMNLFFLVDRDQGGTLSRGELAKMNGYVKAVYGVNLDGVDMDRNVDGEVDIQEFVARFEQQIALKASEMLNREEGSN